MRISSLTYLLNLEIPFDLDDIVADFIIDASPVEAIDCLLIHLKFFVSDFFSDGRTFLGVIHIVVENVLKLASEHFI